MTTYNLPTRRPAPHFSLISILAIAAAIGSFFVGAGAGFFLAIAAIVLGFFGVVLSLLPSTRGGIVSVLAMLAGVLGIVVAIVRLVAHVV